MRKPTLQRAVFIDRDGTLCVDTEFSVDPKKLCPLPGAVEGLRKLQRAGYHLIVITNQSGIARGFFDEAGLQEFHRHMIEHFKEQGVTLTAAYYCPHYPDGKVARYVMECGCRKPHPGMLLTAAREHHLDLRSSWMIGDRDCDIGAGQNAGCRTVRIGESRDGDRDADYDADDIDEAADVILTQE